MSHPVNHSSHCNPCREKAPGSLPHHHSNLADTVLRQLPHDDQIQSVADAMRQLGDASRLRLFWILCHCEECVVNLSAMMEMSSPALSHHLKSLKDSGLIISRRAGKEVYYRAADTELVHALHPMIEALACISCPAAEPAAPANNARPLPQEEVIRQIHAELTANPDTRITIEALSRKYCMNTSTLKAQFKAVYGLPIAVYMKRWRMQEAAALLRDTDFSIAQIAEQVGYSSQSQFTAAFRDVMHKLPSAYRKEHRT